MLGCITLIKKQGAVTGVAAATGRSKRSRAAVAAVAEEQAGAGGDGGTAMMVTTDGKQSLEPVKEPLSSLAQRAAPSKRHVNKHRQGQAVVQRQTHSLRTR